jgi:hypothetical protein
VWLFVLLVVGAVCYSLLCWGCFQGGFAVLLLRAIDGGCWLARFVHGFWVFGGGLALQLHVSSANFLFFTCGCGVFPCHIIYLCFVI